MSCTHPRASRTAPPMDDDGFVRIEDGFPDLGTVCLVKTRTTGESVWLAVYHLEGDAEHLENYHWSWHERIARVTDGYVTRWRNIMPDLDQWLSKDFPRLSQHGK